MTLDTAGLATARAANPILTEGLAELDPEVGRAIAAELHRQQGTLEMIASENFAPVAVHAGAGLGADQQVRRGLPGRRYYGGCEHVDVIEQLAIDRVKALFGAEFANVQPHSGAQANAAVMAALLKPGDTILGLALRPRRPPHPRHADQLLRPAVRRRAPTRCREDDHRVDMDEVERLAREHRPKLIIAGWSAYPRQLDFERVPGDRRRGRRLPDGRHGALRRAGRRRAAPLAGAARARRHDDHAQDARRPARRRHPHQRPGARQEDQLGGVPRPAGRPARARHRRQGGGVQDRRRAGVPRAPGSAPWRAPGSSPSGCCSPTSPSAGIKVLTGGTDVHLVLVDLRELRAGRQAGRGPAAPRSASPSTATPCRSTRGRRWSAPGCGSAPRRWPPAVSTTTTSARSPTSSPPRCGPAFDDADLRRACGPASTRLRGPLPALPDLTEGPAVTAHRPPHGAPGGRPARPPRLPLAQPGAEEALRRRHRRRRRPRARDRVLPGQEPRHHQRRRAGEGLAGRRQHGPQHHDHPVQLPVGRERRHLRALAQAVGGPRGGPRLPDPVQPARRAQPRAQPAGRPRQRAPRRAPTGSTASTPSGSTPSRSRSSARSSTSPRTCATRCSARPTSRGPASPSTTTSPGASPARADDAGRRPHPGLRGHRHRHRRRPGHRRADHPGHHRRGPGRAVRGRAHLRRWPTMVGLRLPLQSHPLQALVSELLEPVHPTVVMSNAVHVYVSQAHKGELVMGAGIDSYNGYGQRGAFHIIERQMAAARRAVPDLRPGAPAADLGRHRRHHPRRLAHRRAHARRGPVPQLRLGHRRLQGDPRRRLVLRPHDRQRRAAPATSRRSPWTGSPPAPWSTSTAPPPWPTETAAPQRAGLTMQLIACPWCGPRDEAEFHYGGQAHVAYPEDPQALTDEAVGALPLLPGQPQGPVRRALVPRAGCRRWFNAVRDTATHQILARLPPRRAEAGDLHERRDAALPTGGRVDRDADAVVHLRRRDVTGHPGDTLASALLANGVHQVATSIKLGRPRGIMAAGAEDPNAPGPDRGAVPRADAAPPPPSSCTTGWWRPACPGRAGWPTEPDPARYDAMHAHCDVLVVGAGPAGLSAALTAARSGARVVLLDDSPRPAASLLGTTDRIDGRAGPGLGGRRRRRARDLPRGTGPAAHHRLRLLRRRLRPRAANGAPTTSALAAPAHLSRQRVWRHPGPAGRGGHRRPRAPGRVRRQRPAGHHARRQCPHLPAPLRRAGRRARAVVFTTNDSAYAAAVDLARRRRARSPPSSMPGRRRPRTGLRASATERGIEVRAGQVVTGTRGDDTRHPGARGRPVDGRARGPERHRLRPAAGLAVAGTPRCTCSARPAAQLRYDDALGAFVPGDRRSTAVSVAGSADGRVRPAGLPRATARGARPLRP